MTARVAGVPEANHREHWPEADGPLWSGRWQEADVRCRMTAGCFRPFADTCFITQDADRETWVAMRIGFLGGSSLAELGPASDVEFFFECACFFGPKRHPELDWDLVTCRLYRHYVRLVDAEATHLLMLRLRAAFLDMKTRDIDHGRAVRGLNSELDFGVGTLETVFDHFFQHFSHCSEAAVLFARTWSMEQPVRIVRSDLPDFISEKKRPLSDYDNVVGRPLWLRQ